MGLDELRAIAINRGISVDGCTSRADLAHRILAVPMLTKGRPSSKRQLPGALRLALDACDECAAIALVAWPALPTTELTAGWPLAGTALHAAAERGLAAACRAILSVDSFDRAAQDGCGRLALHCAASRGRAQTCQVLLEDQRIRDAALGTDMYECTALHYAADCGSVEACEALLEYSVLLPALSIKDGRGNTPIGLAPRGPRGAAVRRVLAAAMDQSELLLGC